MTVRFLGVGVVALIAFIAVAPAHAQQRDPERARYEAVYVKVAIFRDGHVEHEARMIASYDTCRFTDLKDDRRLYSDVALSRMAASIGEAPTPIAVISECFKNPKAGETPPASFQERFPTPVPSFNLLNRDRG
jgi:hypothetical protein